MNSTTGRSRLRRASDWLVMRPWVGVATALVGAAGGALVLALMPSTRDASGQSNQAGWPEAALLVCAFVLAAGLAIVLEWDKRRRFRRGERSQQIERLTSSLREALVAIDSIRIDVEEGERTLADMERRIATQSEVAKLTAEDAEAVRVLVRSEFESDRRAGWRREFLLGLFFFALGYLVKVVLGG